VREGSEQATTDVEVLQEILHYYQRRRLVALGVDVVNHALTLFPEPITVGVSEVTAVGDLMQRNPSLEARDAIHAAVILQHGLEGIISADRGFDAIPEINRFDPRDL
jgi:predicted nucleic acid-binding protein